MNDFAPEALPPIRIAVTGGRDFTDARMVGKVLDAVHATRTVIALAHGGAAGADALADQWARAHGLEPAVFEADWRTLGRKAGPIRNGQMLREFKPDLLVAFPGNAGTKDCRSQAARMGITRLVAAPHPGNRRLIYLEGALP